MAQPVKGVSNPPQSETQAVQPGFVPKRHSEKTAPPQQDTVKISSAGQAASAGSAAKKPEKS